MHKVILIMIDGMRPDGFLNCGHPFADEMRRLGCSTMSGRTVFPSVTLPCHLSMFYSVPPERHGVTTNHFVPFPRPVSGLFEQIKLMGKSSAIVYSWEELRDICQPGCLKYAVMKNYKACDDSDAVMAEKALRHFREDPADFMFLYMGHTDETGHKYGWMSDEYIRCVGRAIGHVEDVYRAFGKECTILVTADHGGHDRTHGTTADEDMTIPMFCLGDPFPAGKTLADACIMDIAPTVADLMGVPVPEEWEGKSLLGKTQ